MKIVEQKSGYLELIPDEVVECPFCHETNFDLIGLKLHFERGWCDVYNHILLDKKT